jgi:hypothetical protein
MTKKKSAGKTQSFNDLIARARANGPPTTEQRLAGQKAFIETIEKMKRDFDRFSDSDEGRAREALRLRLEELRSDPAIRKSDTCIEVLGAFIHCVTYAWGASDSGGMIAPLLPHFDRERARNAAVAKRDNDPKQDDKTAVREHWDLWQTHSSRYRGKAAFARDMLDKYESLRSQGVIERWCRAWEKETLPAK